MTTFSAFRAASIEADPRWPAVVARKQAQLDPP